MKSSEVASDGMSSKIISEVLLLELVPASLIVRLCTLTLESLLLTIFSMAIL